MERNPEEGLGGNAARSSQGFKMTTPFQIATRLLKVFSAADSQHRFQPNGALRRGSIREAQCSVEAFFCHSFALLHSVVLRRRSSHPSCARHVRQQTLLTLARFPPFVTASGLHGCYAVSADRILLRASFVFCHQHLSSCLICLRAPSLLCQEPLFSSTGPLLFNLPRDPPLQL